MTRRRRLVVWGLRLATLAALVGGWLYLQGPGHVSPLILPRMSKVGTAIGELLKSDTLWTGVRTTLLEAAVAASLATFAGLAVGFAMSRTRFRALTTEPILVWGFMTPLILFYPLLLLWLGVGMWSKVGYASVSAFFPIAYNALRAFRSVDPKYMRLAHAFGATPRQTDREIKLRAGLPVLGAGVRIGLAVALITVIVSEMIASTAGLGFMITLSSQTFDPATEFATILFVMVLVGLLQGVIALAFADRLHRRIRKKIRSLRRREVASNL